MFTTNFNMNYAESIGSMNSSLGSSFLAAANTVILDSASSSSPFAYQSPSKSARFSNTLLQIQQNGNDSDLDFDLHYSQDTKRKKADTNYNLLFKDDDNLFDESQDMDEDEEDDLDFLDNHVRGNVRNDLINQKISRNMPIDLNNQASQKNQIPSLSSSHCASITPTSNLLTDCTPQNSVSTKFSSSRTFMKLQLMKQQAEEMERKSGNLSSTLVNDDSINIYLGNNSSVKKETNIPSSLTSLETIPRSVVSDVYQTKLEFPTRYHVQQVTKHLQNQNQIIQNDPKSKRLVQATKPRSRINSGKPNTVNQSKSSQYQQQIMSLNDLHTNLDHSNNIEITRNSSSLQSDYILPSTVSSQYSYDSQNSNLDSTRLTSPSNSSFSQNEYFEELEDLVPDDLNSVLGRKSYSTQLTNLQIQDEINQIEEVLNLPKTAPNEGYFNSMTPPLAPSIRPSSSCPSDIARLKKLQGIHLTEDEIKILIKERQKKDNHNMIERRRRFNINDRIKELGTILPKSTLNDKQNKGSILKASVDYIRNLQREAVKTKELEDKLSQMTILNRKLMEKIKSIENLAKSNENQNQSLMSLVSGPSMGQKLETMIKSDSTLVNFDLNLNQKQINQFENFINQQEQQNNNYFENVDVKSLEEMLNLGTTNQFTDPLLTDPSLLEDMDSFN